LIQTRLFGVSEVESDFRGNTNSTDTIEFGVTDKLGMQGGGEYDAKEGFSRKEPVSSSGGVGAMLFGGFTVGLSTDGGLDEQ